MSARIDERIPKQDLETIKTFTSKDPLSTVKRIAECAVNNPVMIAEATFHGAGRAMGCAIVGAAVAGAVSEFVVPGSGPFAAKAGGALGLAAGAAWGAERYIEGPDAQKLYACFTAEQVYPVFARYLLADELFQYTCPLTKDLIRVPVKVKGQQGSTFEQSAILEHLNTKRSLQGREVEGDPNGCAQGAQCCIQCGQIEKSKLVYDETYHSRLLPKLEELIKNPEKIAKADQKSLEQVRQAMIEQRKRLIEPRAAAIFSAALGGNLSQRDALSELGALMSQFRLA